MIYSIKEIEPAPQEPHFPLNDREKSFIESVLGINGEVPEEPHLIGYNDNILMDGSMNRSGVFSQDIYQVGGKSIHFVVRKYPDSSKRSLIIDYNFEKKLYCMEITPSDMWEMEESKEAGNLIREISICENGKEIVIQSFPTPDPDILLETKIGTRIGKDYFDTHCIIKINEAGIAVHEKNKGTWESTFNEGAPTLDNYLEEIKNRLSQKNNMRELKKLFQANQSFFEDGYNDALGQATASNSNKHQHQWHQ